MIYRFTLDLINTRVVVGTSEDEMMELANSYGIELELRGFSGRATEIERDDEVAYLLYIRADERTAVEILSTLSHEVQHVVDYVCRTFGFDDLEFRGYLHGFMTKKILKRFIREKILTIKKGGR